MRQYIVGLLTVIVVIGGLTWWAFAPWLRQDINTEMERRGWDPVFVEPEPPATWSMTLKPEDYMADTGVEESYNMSCVLHVMNQDQSPNMTSAALSVIQVQVGGVDAYLYDATTDGGWPDGTVPDGKTAGEDGFVFKLIVGMSIEEPDAFEIDGETIYWYWLGESTNWECKVSYSVEADHSHVDRDENTNVHMGSDTGPTHSNERYFSDEWEESDEKIVVYEIEDTTLTSQPGYEIVVPAPNANIVFTAAMHKSAAGDIQYGAWEDIQCSNIDLVLDGIYEDWSSGNFRTEGDGAALEIWHRDPDVTFAGDYDWTNNVRPPYIIDWTKMGLADWQKTVHSDRYDGIWVDGGFVCCSYLDMTWYEDASPGDSSPVKLGELHGISPYTQQVAPFSGWDLQDDWDYEFMQGAARYLKIVDCDENRAQDIPESYLGQYIPIGVPDLTHSDCESDPKFEILLEVEEIDFDLGSVLGYRASEWYGEDGVEVEGGGVDTSASFDVTVPSGGGVLKRDLVDPSAERAQYYANPDDPAPYEFQVAAWWHLANESPGGHTWPEWPSDWEDPPHDVYDMSWCRYFVFDASPDISIDDGTKIGTLTLSYRIPTVTDNRLTLPDWEGSYSWEETGTVSFDVYYDSGTDSLFVDMGLADSAERPELTHVSAVSLSFDGEGEEVTWTVSGVRLIPFDSSIDPRSGDDWPTQTRQMVTMHEVLSQYAAGGIRGNSDGLFRNCLNMLYNHDVWSGHERLVEMINWRFSIATDTDQSGAWTLADYLSIVKQCKQGWTASLPDDWDNMTVDENDETLTSGYSFDVMETQDYDIEDGNCQGHFKAWKWETVKGILYKPHGIWCVEGGTHNLENKRLVSRDVERQYGENDWELHETVTTDRFGYWSSGGPVVAEYDEEDNPVYWQYRSGNDVLSRLYPRQWEYLDLRFVAPANLAAVWQPTTSAIMVTDASIADDLSAGHRILRTKAAGSTPRWSDRYAVPGSSEVQWGNIICTPSQEAFVESGDDTHTRFAASLNGDWWDAEDIETGYTCAYGIESQRGPLYITAYSGGKQYLLRREKARPYVALNDPVEIGPSGEVSAGLVQHKNYWSLVAALQSGTSVTLYRSDDEGRSWSEVRTVSDMTYPYLCANSDYTWLLGYSDGTLYVTRYLNRDNELPERMGRTEVGQADEGRSAIHIRPHTQNLYVFAVKGSDWGQSAATPGIAEYRSTDMGRSWTLKAIHGLNDADSTGHTPRFS